MNTKGLNTLIRLRKRELDDLQKARTDLERNREVMYEALAKLKAEIEEEARLAGEDLNLAAYFSGFIQQARKREEGIQKGINLLDEEIERLQEKIREAFSELKKLDIALELELQRQRERQAHIEQENLNEMGLRGYLKQQEDSGEE